MVHRWLLLVGLMVSGCREASKPALIGELEVDQAVQVVFSPDSRWLAAGNQLGQVTVFDAQGHKKLSPPEAVGRIEALAVGPEKLAYCGASEPTACVWDVAQSKTVGRATVGALAVAAQKIEHHAVEWVDTRTGKVSGSVSYVGGKQGGQLNFLAFAPGGRLVANDAHGCLSWWDDSSLKPLGSLPQASKRYGYGRAALSADGSRVAVSGYTSSEVVSFELASGLRLFRWPGLQGVSDLAYSPDSSRLAICAQGGVYLADASRGESLVNWKCAAHRVCFRQDGRWLAASGNQSAVWDLKTQAEIIPNGRYEDIAFVGNSNLLFALWEHEAVYFDVAAKKPLAEIKGEFKRVGVSPDGKLAVLVPRQGKVQLWSIP